MNPGGRRRNQVSVVQKVNNAIYRINHYPADKHYSTTNWVIQWIVIYAVDNAIHASNNWDQLSIINCFRCYRVANIIT